jgi:hypothetical protein
MQEKLSGNWRQCLWVSRKDRCKSHTTHDWSTDFEVPVAEAIDRREATREVLNSVAAFAGSTDLSFRRAAGDATLKFASDLIDLGISISGQISSKTRAVDIFDCFSAFSIQHGMSRLADEKLEASMARLEDIRFVNIAIDSDTFHSLTPIHCIILNPFMLTRPVLFDLCENLHFTTGNYAALFENIMRRLMP